MELFEFCMEIIKREGERFNVGVNTSTASQITAATAADVNYDIAHNRCDFLYRCGAINLYFAKDCFNKFLSDYKGIVFLLSKWVNSPNLTLCSISKGPALDYIALLLSYQESGMFPLLFKNIKIVAKYGAWRNTANIMHEIISEGYLKSLPPLASIGNIEVIQGDPFKDFTQKIKDPVCNSDVVLMLKTLNLQADGYNQKKISKSLQEFLNALKPGAILFCIDTKPSIAVITKLLTTFPGKILFESTYMNTKINLEYAEFYKNLFGCLPVVSARGSFFVWQKLELSPSSLECIMDEVSESAEHLLKVNDILDNNSCSTVAADGCSEELPNGDISTSTSFDNWRVTNSVESKSNDQQSVDSFNIGTQDSKYFPSSSSSQNGLPATDHVKKGRENIRLVSSEPMFNSSVTNVCMQTEPENKLKGTERSRIMQLTNRIANLTTEFSEMLATSALGGCTDDNCFKKSEEACKHSVLNGCSHSHCSSVIACPHKCPCSNFLPCVQNYCRVCNCCQNHMCQQGYLTSNQRNSNTSLGDCDATKCCSSSYNTGSDFSTENNSSSTPQLVIPLNNLSADAVSQIISLLNQSN